MKKYIWQDSTALTEYTLYLIQKSTTGLSKCSRTQLQPFFLCSSLSPRSTFLISFSRICFYSRPWISFIINIFKKVFLIYICVFALNIRYRHCTQGAWPNLEQDWNLRHNILEGNHASWSQDMTKYTERCCLVLIWKRWPRKSGEWGGIRAPILSPTSHFEESSRSLNGVNQLIRAQWLLHQTIIRRNDSLAHGTLTIMFSNTLYSNWIHPPPRLI